MPRAKISIQDKERIIAAHENGDDYMETARVLGIVRGTAWSIIRRHQHNGVVALPRGGPRNRKVDDEMRNACVAIVDNHPEYTLVQIKRELEVELPNKPRVCINTISNILDGQLITTKKLETNEQERNRDDVKISRRHYAEWLNIVGGEENLRELIFVDESGFHLWLARTRGRAPIGQRAVRIVGGRKGPHFSLIIAISNVRGLLYHDIFEGGTNHQRFNAFMETASQAAGDNNATFIFDNASCHRRVGEANLNPNHETRFLPPYSPFLNIAENAFSTWKMAFKAQLAEVRPILLEAVHAERLATLIQLGEQNIDVLTPAKAASWYRKTTTYIPRCVQLQDIVQNHA